MTRHHYYSTYCFHGLHDDCRLTCKTCHAPCECACHFPDGGVCTREDPVHGCRLPTGDRILKSDGSSGRRRCEVRFRYRCPGRRMCRHANPGSLSRCYRNGDGIDDMRRPL